LVVLGTTRLDTAHLDVFGAKNIQTKNYMSSSSSPPAHKKAKLSEMSTSSNDSKSETYPVIDRVANGAHVRGMEAYQAM